jgi:hypothetical protein
MQKSILTFSAAMIAAAIAALPSPQVRAGRPGDQVEARLLGTACSQREWPYFAVPCLRDPKRPFGEARQVRIVSIDHLPPLTDSKPR